MTDNKRPLRVVFSIGALHGGGSERQLVTLLKALDRSRVEPILYLVYRSGPLLSEVPSDVPVVAFSERCTRNLTFIPGLMHRLRVHDLRRFLIEAQADVSYDRTFLMTLIAADAAQQAAIPNVSTIVTDPSLGFAPVAGRFQWWKRRLLHRLYMKSSLVLANSAGAARSAERFYGLPANSVQVLYNGVDADHLRQVSAAPVEDEWWNRPASKRIFRMVAAGRLNHEKGFHLLIDAIHQLRQRGSDVDLRLAILGEGPAEERLNQQISRLQLTEHVRLVGFRNNAPAWIRSANLFVLPSLLEGMPNVLLEAMSVGTPVLSADCPSGPREILDNGCCGMLCPVNSVPALIDSLRQFIDNEDLTTKLCANAAQRVRENFSIQHAARTLEDHFERIAHRQQ
ncbi:MAG: glycosyltransferase [Planctomycetaceae bacterium]|nr:glycosyltransferase [Planctomycetaceae bacterium]